MQGYFFSEALPPLQLEKTLREKKDWGLRSSTGLSAVPLTAAGSHH